MLNVPYVLAMYGPMNEDRQDADEPRSAQIARTLGNEWIPIMRGVQVTLRPSYEKIKNSELKSIVTVPNWDDFDVSGDAISEDDARFLRLSETWKNHSESDVEVYDKTLGVLRRCCAWAARLQNDYRLRDEGYNHEWSSPFMWIHISPESYFALLQQRQPPALIMFAYFGALLHQLDHYWWIRGWGTSLVNAVDELLGSYWAPWMEWPKQAILQDEKMVT